jgi:mycothiol S-conjugate amidase
METPRSEALCLLTIHAHPDDEASKGAGSVARYHAEGVRTVLVCCTGGEEGDILNPAMDRDDVRADIGRIREQELDRAAAIIGYDEVVRLGYRDSGMPDSEANKNPAAFANAPLEEAVDKLVEVLRRERPQVVVTYDDEQTYYPHPDHLRVNEITRPAVDAAADPAHRPDLGPAWQVSKIYFTSWSMKRAMAMHEKFLELGMESPLPEAWLSRPPREERTTTTIDIAGYNHIQLDALLAHATQIDPNSPFWFGLPREVADEIHPFDEYVLAWTAPGVEVGPYGPEDRETDLFAGVRETASSSADSS